VLAPDPGPGGLGSVLSYNLLGPPGLVAGDVFLLEPGGGPISDIIRFNPAGTGSPGYPASLLFYSNDISGGLLADVGLPTANYTNTVTLTETLTPSGFFGYTPTAAQPGFVPGFSVSYNFSRADAAVPEPASIAMLGTGALAFLGYARRRRKRAVA
jgi:hypothetical protein